MLSYSGAVVVDRMLLRILSRSYSLSPNWSSKTTKENHTSDHGLQRPGCQRSSCSQLGPCRGKGPRPAHVPAGVRIKACRMSDSEMMPTMLSASFTTTSRCTCQRDKQLPCQSSQKVLRRLLANNVFHILNKEDVPEVRDRNHVKNHKRS